MRLYDRIMRETWETPWDLSESVLVDAGNVQEYWSQHHKGSSEHYLEMLPAPVMPPFGKTWIECSSYNGGQLGVGVSVSPEQDAMGGTIFYSVPKKFIKELAPTGTSPTIAIIPLGVWLAKTDSEWMPIDVGFSANDSAVEMLGHDVVDILRYIAMDVSLLTLCFMNCKNVTIEDAPLKGSRQQRRALERKGIKQARFKTLVIEPMKQVLKTEGGIETNGLKKALHICRGHFATYSEDKPLFGKYSGTFWKPAHVRGNADHGTVYKDYKVKAPKGKHRQEV